MSICEDLERRKVLPVALMRWTKKAFDLGLLVGISLDFGPFEKDLLTSQEPKRATG